MKRFSLIVLAALAAMSPAQAAVPEVVTSVRPVHAIASVIMTGIGTPTLLLGSAASLHAHALKPSEARQLSRAQVVFWVGPQLEAFLVKPIAALSEKAKVVSLITAPGVEALPARSGGLWETDDHDHDHAGVPDPGQTKLLDGHIWLNPLNAIAMANAMAETLATADPVNAQEYWANAQSFSKDATALDRELHVRLADEREKPFLVFHDAYQYFENRYRLAALGSVSVTPEQPPGARRLSAIQERLRGAGPVCLFAEPQFEPRYVQMLIEGTGARTGVLDPEGTALKDGPGLYFSLMRNLATELERCMQ